MVNQTDRVLIHIWEHEEISALEAARLDVPIMRLASRICEIRKAGWDIPDRWEKTSTGGRYKVYCFSTNDYLRFEGGTA